MRTYRNKSDNSITLTETDRGVWIYNAGIKLEVTEKQIVWAQWELEPEQPEFKAGDWVIGKDDYFPRRAEKVTKVIGDGLIYDGLHESAPMPFEYIRHATPAEIEAAKPKPSLLFADLKGTKTAVHCKTQEEWDKVTEICGYEWQTSLPLKLYYNKTCINLCWEGFGTQDKAYYDYTIIPAAEFIAANTPEQVEVKPEPKFKAGDWVVDSENVYPNSPVKVHNSGITEGGKNWASWIGKDGKEYKTIGDHLCPAEPPKEPLHIGKDGQPIYEGDRFWYCYKTGLNAFDAIDVPTYSSARAAKGDIFSDKFCRFSTESACQEYLDSIHKPKPEPTTYTRADLERLDTNQLDTPFFIIPKSAIK